MNKIYNEWLNSKYLDNSDKEILKNMNEEEINKAFSKELEFGTAGIRGIMGLGNSRLNKYTIGRITIGLSKYLNKNYDNPSVVVAFDTRNNSKDFAYEVCKILNTYNIKTYLFEEYTSTPELAFSVKYLKCSSGIVITSSHNSKIYNGYKVYNASGGQIVYPEDELILKEINNTDMFESAKIELKNSELFNIVNKEVHEAFIKEDKKALINEDLLKNNANKFNITYSSLHGVGLNTMKEIFDEYNVNYNIVTEQCTFDGNFPTAPEPNPEYIENYDLAIKYAKENNSDVIILSDPDADRLGVMYKSMDNYKLLSGNMLGTVFAYYIVNNKNLNSNNYFVRSLPTSNMIDALSKKYNVKTKEVLTGCKNIAYLKNKDKDNYLFGYEESLGYMFNINIDDKNAFSSSLVLMEILCYLKENNMTLEDYIDKIYKEIGYFNNYSTSITYDSVDKAKDIMVNLRCNRVDIDNLKEIVDYKDRNDNLKTDALKFIFNDDSYFILRPSGTEPKLKIYIGSSSNTMNDCNVKIENIKNLTQKLLK